MTSEIVDIKRIELPLVLISQVQRSGGTLLSQLFDGHPQIYAFPSELHLVKAGWLDASDFLNDFRKRLSKHDKMIAKFLREGYQKFSIIDDGDRFPFEFDLALRDEILSSVLKSKPSRRDVFNAFFTAFFTAWRSRRPLLADPKYVVAFAARTNMYLDTGRPGFFEDYPNGRLVSVFRRPLSWFGSARRHSPKYETFSAAMQLWIDSARASLELQRMFTEQVAILTFESLISETADTMQNLCQFLGIEFDPILTVPTFDGRPIKSDSNFKPAYGIDLSVLNREDFSPEAEADRQLLRTAEQLYEEGTAANRCGIHLSGLRTSGGESQGEVAG